MSNLSSRGVAWETVRAYVLQRDEYVCAYGCGNTADTVDHVTPKANGGTDDEWNLVAACRRCNGIKGAKVLTRINWVNKKWLTNV